MLWSLAPLCGSPQRLNKCVREKVFENGGRGGHLCSRSPSGRRRSAWRLPPACSRCASTHPPAAARLETVWRLNLIVSALLGHLLRLLLQLAYLRALRVERHLDLKPTALITTTHRRRAALTRNISLFFAMNSLVFSRSRRTGGSVVVAAASLLRMGALTSARESMDFTNSADA